MDIKKARYRALHIEDLSRRGCPSLVGDAASGSWDIFGPLRRQSYEQRKASNVEVRDEGKTALVLFHDKPIARFSFEPTIVAEIIPDDQAVALRAAEREHRRSTEARYQEALAQARADVAAMPRVRREALLEDFQVGLLCGPDHAPKGWTFEPGHRGGVLRRQADGVAVSARGALGLEAVRP